jgi:phospholipid-binding lipoprotein MlaA
VIAVTAFALAGCATPPSDPAERAAYEEANDPLEPMNRTIFSVNETLQKEAFDPVARIYRDNVPEEVRYRIRHVLNNLSEPVVFCNAVLEGRIQAALTTFWRFFFNSTLGLGGVLEVGDDLNLPAQHADFGRTLYSWGSPSGPYLVLPVFGPSNFRDAVGFGVDNYFDPVGQVIGTSGVLTPGLARTAVSGIDTFAQNLDTLAELRRSSIDFYALLRSISRQHRNAELGITSPETPPAEDIYSDPGAPPKP